MRFYTTLLAVAPLLLQVRADLDLDLDDVPSVCRDTCRPVAQLADRCHVDLRGDDNDRQEDLLEAQCFCTNGSFDVEAVSALCLDCIRQNYNSTSTDRDDDHDHDDHHDGDDDDWDDHDHDDHHTRKRDHDDDDDDDHDDHDDAWKDINDIVRTCSFSSTSWSAQAAATSVSVSAERPTDASQLTTTFTAASQTSGGNSPIQTSPSDDNSNDDNSNDDNSNDDNSNSNSGDNNDDGGAAAGLAAPVFMAGALVVGAAAFLV